MPPVNEDNNENEEMKEEGAEETPVVDDKVDDRPEANYKAELQRRRVSEEKLRQELDSLKKSTVQKRDPNDLATWADHELKAVKYSNDPKILPLKDEADDILTERKFDRLREKERMQEKRAFADIELKRSYPDAQDPESALSAKMEEVMHEYDLQKSPAGRLAAAKIAASELGLGKSKTDAKARKAEADRVARVKGNMVDGDRAKSASGESPKKKAEDIADRIRSEKSTDHQGIGDLLDSRGVRDKWAKFWGE